MNLSYEEISQQLKTGDVQTRLNLLRSLMGRQEREIRECLIEAMGDSEWRVRKEAVAVMVKMEDKHQAIDAMLDRIVKNDNVGRRNAALEVFLQWGKLSVPTLLTRLRGLNEDTQKALIDVLGDIRDPRAVTPLLRDILSGGPIEEVSAGFADNLRSSALEAVGKIRSPHAVEQILFFLNKDNPLLTFSAIKALELIGSAEAVPRLIEISKEKLFKRAALEALGVIGDIHALDCLLAAFHSEQENIRRVTLKAIVALESKQTGQNKRIVRRQVKGAYTEDDYAFLVSILDHSDPFLKRGAICVLGWASEFRAIPVLILLLNEYDKDVIAALVAMGPSVLPELLSLVGQGVWEDDKMRQAAATIFGEIADPAGTPTLLDLLRDNSAHVREAAANALGRIRDNETILPLMALLKDSYPEVQESAVRSLLEMKSHLPKVDLLHMMQGESPHLRANAALLLGEIGHDAAIPDIAFLLKDPDEDVRRAAVCALGRFPQGKNIRPLLTALGDEDYKVRVAVLKVLEQQGAESVLDDLSPLLHDDNIWVRAALARTIDRGSGEKGLAILLKLSEDPTGVVQIAALVALGRRQEKEILPVILKHMTSADREVKKAAILALGTFGDPAALANVTPLLEDPHWALRAAAASAVGSLNTASSKLQEMADADEDPLVRDAARWALSRLEKRSAPASS